MVQHFDFDSIQNGATAPEVSSPLDTTNRVLKALS